MCSFYKINSLLIDIIDSLDDDKSCNILEEKAFKAAKLRKDALKEDTFLIFQNLKFPFDINNRNIKCFNKENSFKVKNKNIQINKMTNLEDKLLVFIFGISNINENDYNLNMNSIEDFIKQTLELINKGKIVTLELNIDVEIDWYGNNIITSLNGIKDEDEYKKDNYKKLFEEMKIDLEESINDSTNKSNLLYNLYSKLDLLPEKEINALEKCSEIDADNLINTDIENEEKQIFSCYTLNKKILDYVKQNHSIDECILILKGINPEKNNIRKDENKKEKENNSQEDISDLPLDILNFPNIISNEGKKKQINNINNYLQIDRYFENELKKKEIKVKIKNDDSVVKKVFDYVLTNALKKGLNEVEYYSRRDDDLRKKLKPYCFTTEEEKKNNNNIIINKTHAQLTQITSSNFFTNELKDYVEKFQKEFKKCIIFFELEGEPNQKMKYLEDAYDIVKNVYELSASSATFDIQTIILLWKYFIMNSSTKKLFSSFLILHLFIRKDLLTITQVEILFAVKEVIDDIFNLSNDQFIYNES